MPSHDSIWSTKETQNTINRSGLGLRHTVRSGYHCVASHYATFEFLNTKSFLGSAFRKCYSFSKVGTLAKNMKKLQMSRQVSQSQILKTKIGPRRTNPGRPRPRNVMIGGGWEPLAVFITHSESALHGHGLFCFNALLVWMDNTEDIWYVLQWKSRRLPAVCMGGVCTVCICGLFSILTTLFHKLESENQTVINDRKQVCRSETARP